MMVSIIVYDIDFIIIYIAAKSNAVNVNDDLPSACITDLLLVLLAVQLVIFLFQKVLINLLLCVSMLLYMLAISNVFFGRY